jgi:hypothetical protein
MPRYLFTVIVFLIAVLAFAYETSGKFFSHVSPETTKLAMHRETQRVTVGQSIDGALMIRAIANASHVPVQARYANHSRTLRAYVAPNHSGVPALYLEAARPRASYVLEGAFSISADDASFTWVTTTTLMFYGRSSDGALTRFVVDVHNLTISGEAIAVIPSHDDRPVFDTNI